MSTQRFLEASYLVGGVSGLRNYITNGNIEKNVEGWVAYADAAGATPVDGTGGSPNVTVTRSTSSPLAGPANLLLTKDAANRQGQGASYNFSIDLSDTNKFLEISFDFSTTATLGSASDVRVYIYDVTNTTLITPSVTRTNTDNRYIAQFNSTNSQSYRLILHVATTSASAWTFAANNICVSRLLKPVAEVRASGTPTGSLSAASATIWGTESRDVTGSYNNSNGEFTCPWTGSFWVSAFVLVGGTEAADNFLSLTIYVDGVAQSESKVERIPVTSLTSSPASITALVFAGSGSVITLRTNTNIGSPSFAAGGWLNIRSVW